MKKRVLAIMMAMAMAASMAACGSKTEEAPAADAATSAAEEAAPAEDGDGVYNISFIVKLTDGHFNKVMAGAQAYADEHDNVNVEINSPTSATAYDEQINMIETALSNDKIDGLVVAPLQSDSAANLVANTEKAVVACDTDFTSDKKATFVGTGNKDAAKSGGVAAVEAAKAAGVEKPTVVVLTGVQGDETHDARLEGYKEGVEEAGGEVIEVQYCDGIADKASVSMEAVMQKFQDGIDVVLSTNDDMAMAAAKVVTDSGNAAYDNTIICGFDGNQSAIEAIKGGVLGMDVAQLGWDMGYKAMEAIITVLEGGSVESFTDSGSKVVATDNADEYIEDMKAKGLWE